MQKFEIQLNLEHIKQARKAYNTASREFGERVEKAMKRLIHEAAAQRMSITEVGKLSGFTSTQIKARMKAMNLNPTTGKTLLSKQAADVLASNAEIMGIEPREIDLMSPLAYLPAGSLLKDKAQSKGVTVLTFDVLADTIYEQMPWEGETYQAVAENIAAALLNSGWTHPEGVVGWFKEEAFPETDVDYLFKTLTLIATRGGARVEVDGQAYEIRADLTEGDRLVLTQENVALLVRASEANEAGA